MKLPLVTVVTPNYNYEKFIAETISSVLKQDYPNIEYIVVDDGSTDNSVSVIKEILSHNPNSFKLIEQNNSGQSSALNNGFRNSNGEILCWLNSDDLFEPSAVSIAVDFLKRNKNVDMVFGENIQIDKKGNMLRVNRGCYWGKLHFRFQQRMEFQNSAFWRRKIFFDCGMIDEYYQFCMDYELFIRLDMIGKIAFLPFHLSYYRYHNSAKSVRVHKGKWDRGVRENDEMFLKNYGKMPSIFIKNLLSSRIFSYFCSRYWRLIRLSDTSRAEEIRETNFRSSSK